MLIACTYNAHGSQVTVAQPLSPLVVWAIRRSTQVVQGGPGQKTLWRKHPSERARASHALCLMSVTPSFLHALHYAKRARSASAPGDASSAHRAERQLRRQRTSRCIDLGEGVSTLV